MPFMPILVSRHRVAVPKSLLLMTSSQNATKRNEQKGTSFADFASSVQFTPCRHSSEPRQCLFVLSDTKLRDVWVPGISVKAVQFTVRLNAVEGDM